MFICSIRSYPNRRVLVRATEELLELFSESLSAAVEIRVLLRLKQNFRIAEEELCSVGVATVFVFLAHLFYQRAQALTVPSARKATVENDDASHQKTFTGI